MLGEGTADVGKSTITLNVYTHLDDDDVKDGLFSLANNPAYRIHDYQQPDLSAVEDADDGEGDPNLDEEPDDDGDK